MTIDENATYYDEGNISTIDIIKAKLTPVQYEGFLLGLSLKYMLRANFKADKVRDIQKAITYLELLLKDIH